MEINDGEDEIPQLTLTPTIVLAGIALSANFLVMTLTLLVKPSFWNQLLQLHQLFTAIINTIHLVWIPLFYDEDKECFAIEIPVNWDTAIVSLVYFSWYSCPSVVLLLSLSRYLETRKQHKILESHPNRIIAAVCFTAVLPCSIFPIQCSRPYLSLCTLSLEQYHRVDDPQCYTHSLITHVILLLTLVILPTLLDLLTFYNLHKQDRKLGDKRTYYLAKKIKQTFLGLIMCAALHIVHSTRLFLYFYSNFVFLTPTVYFLMNTGIWLVQHITESVMCTVIVGAELIEQKKLIERWK